MKRLLFGLVALPFLAGVSLAAQPVPLSDTQMDAVVAGVDYEFHEVQNLGTVWVYGNRPLANVCGLDGTCFLAIRGTSFPNGTQSMQVYAAFGHVP